MIEEILFDTIYEFNSHNSKGTFKFIRDERDYTYLTFNFNTSEETFVKTFLLTKEKELDEFDLENVNLILKSNQIELKN